VRPQYLQRVKCPEISAEVISSPHYLLLTAQSCKHCTTHRLLVPPNLALRKAQDSLSPLHVLRLLSRNDRHDRFEYVVAPPSAYLAAAHDLRERARYGGQVSLPHLSDLLAGTVVKY
jgi:hypothetical protein